VFAFFMGLLWLPRLDSEGWKPGAELLSRTSNTLCISRARIGYSSWLIPSAIAVRDADMATLADVSSPDDSKITLKAWRKWVPFQPYPENKL
jgi:hypothetical protein